VDTFAPTTLNTGWVVEGQGNVNGSRSTLLPNENYLSFNKINDEKHSMSVIGGYSYQSQTNESWGVAGSVPIKKQNCQAVLFKKSLIHNYISKPNITKSISTNIHYYLYLIPNRYRSRDLRFDPILIYFIFSSSPHSSKYPSQKDSSPSPLS